MNSQFTETCQKSTQPPHYQKRNANGNNNAVPLSTNQFGKDKHKNWLKVRKYTVLALLWGDKQSHAAQVELLMAVSQTLNIRVQIPFSSSIPLLAVSYEQMYMDTTETIDGLNAMQNPGLDLGTEKHLVGKSNKTWSLFIFFLTWSLVNSIY